MHLIIMSLLRFLLILMILIVLEILVRYLYHIMVLSMFAHDLSGVMNI